MIAVIREAGVTSKAGLNTGEPSGRGGLAADPADLRRLALLDGDLGTGR